MSLSLSRLHRSLFGVAVSASLLFGAGQALAAPKQPEPPTCDFTNSAEHLRCQTWCQSRGIEFGACNRTTGKCACIDL